MRQKISILLITLFLMMAATPRAFAGPPEVPAKKQTSLDLYVTATEAWAMWQANPEKTVILDVRTQEEYMLVGHAPMAHNIPVMLLKPTREKITMKPNPDFVSQVTSRFNKDTTLLLMCRSGGRSAKAVNKLAKAGYTKAYNIIDGFEGGKVKKKESPHFGKRMVNGWKNSGAPWTYDLNRKLLYLP